MLKSKSPVEEANISIWWKENEEDEANPASPKEPQAALEASLVDLVIQKNDEPFVFLKNLSPKDEKVVEGLKRNLSNVVYCLVEAAYITLDIDDQLESEQHVTRLPINVGLEILRNLSDRLTYYRDRWELVSKQRKNEKNLRHAGQPAKAMFVLTSSSLRVKGETVELSERRAVQAIDYTEEQPSVGQRLDCLLAEIKNCLNSLERKEKARYKESALAGARMAESLLMDFEVVSSVVMKGFDRWAANQDPAESFFENGRSSLVTEFKRYLDEGATPRNFLTGRIQYELGNLFQM